MEKKELVKTIPLLSSIALTAVIVTLFGAAGRVSAYADLRYEFRASPVMALFFTGLAEGRLPFGAGPKNLNAPARSGTEVSKAPAGAPSVDAQPVVDVTEVLIDVQPAPAAVSEDGSIVRPEVLMEDHMQPAHNVNLAVEEATWDTATRNKYSRIALLADPETDIAPTQYFALLPSYSNEFQTVDATYFKDALFLGDSRTVGLSMYVPELNAQATFYARTSLTAAHALEQRFVGTPLGTVTVLQALQQTSFRKIYIALGVNELGSGTTEGFVQNYARMIEEIRALQPDAIIYISSMMHVSEAKDNEGGYVNNAVINERNNALSQLADNDTVFYIDMNEATDDASGVLQADLTFDGVHLKAVSYDLWYRFLLDHAIVKE